MTGFAHSQGTNKYVNDAVNEPPRLAGKKVKCRSLSEPIGLQDLEDSARSQAWNKINKEYFCIIILNFFKECNFGRKVVYFVQYSRNIFFLQYLRKTAQTWSKIQSD